MDASQTIQELLRPDAYPHPVEEVQLIETHLSWVFLTGDDAYKVKKPVRFDFVDFGTLERRKHFCDEELRCNRAFAPELYLDVVPIVRTADDTVRIGGDQAGAGEVLDWAVHMVQFPQDQQADRLLEGGGLSLDELRAFGATLHSTHGSLPRMLKPVDQAAALKANFDTLRSSWSADPYREVLDRLETATVADIEAMQSLMVARHAAGFVRECHGDLHLANLVRTPDGIRAFDCLEFDIKLRNIDVWCDAGFLFMDCSVRNRDDLAYAFVDGYLDAGGDYEGVTLLPLYARYRSMVRAKVAALRLDQAPDNAKAATKLETHVGWAECHGERGCGKLLVMCGLSGSGKSYWASRLVPELGAVRLRSDVLRKTQLGVDRDADTDSAVGAGAYAEAQSTSVYESLGTLARTLLAAGENVIIDAASLRAGQRQILYRAAAEAGASSLLVHLTAPEPVLRRRLEARQREGGDPSEADAEVLAWQQVNAELPAENEPVLTVNTEGLTTTELVTRISSSAGD